MHKLSCYYACVCLIYLKSVDTAAEILTMQTIIVWTVGFDIKHFPEDLSNLSDWLHLSVCMDHKLRSPHWAFERQRPAKEFQTVGCLNSLNVERKTACQQASFSILLWDPLSAKEWLEW